MVDAPATRQFMNNPNNAVIAHDDIGGLTAIERAARALRSSQFKPRFLGDTPDDAVSRIESDVDVSDLGRAFARGVVGDFAGRTLEGAGALFGATGRILARPLERALEAIGLGAVVEAQRGIVPDFLAPAEILARPGRELREAGEAIGPEDESFATDVAGGLGQVAGQITAALLTGGVSTVANLATLAGQPSRTGNGGSSS